LIIRGGVRRCVIGLLVAVAIAACRGPDPTPTPQTGGGTDTPIAILARAVS
jgi:hypothetical protein